MAEPHYTQQDLRAAERERILWAMLGANSHTEASQKIAQLNEKITLQEIALDDMSKFSNEREQQLTELRELVSRLEARIVELRNEVITRAYAKATDKI